MKYVLLIALLGAVLGVAACGGGSESQAQKQLAQAHVQIRTERQAAQADLDSLQSQATDQRNEISDMRAKLARLRRKVARVRATLGQVRQQAQENTIPGTGTFEVGKDISPGTYRADASPGCYWKRLNSLDTSDIADNDNADGPVAVTIQPSDAAFETDGCADFHKAS